MTPEEIIEQAMTELIKQKEGIIKGRLKDLKLLYKLKHSKERRFKKIMVVTDPEGNEQVYVDNNTIGGLKVVTFFKAEPQMVDGQISIDLKYI